MNAYYPNPFDFVPFSKQEIILKTVEEWKEIDTALVSGTMQIEIEALTPVHSVGKQTTNGIGQEIKKSYFNQEEHQESFRLNLSKVSCVLLLKRPVIADSLNSHHIIHAKANIEASGWRAEKGTMHWLRWLRMKST